MAQTLKSRKTADQPTETEPRSRQRETVAPRRLTAEEETARRRERAHMLRAKNRARTMKQ